MPNLSRRRLFASAASLSIGGALVACAGQSVPAGIQQAAADVKLIAQGFAGILPAVAKIAGVSTGTIARVAGDTNELTTLAGTLAGLPTTTQAMSVVQQVEEGVNDVVAVLSSIAPALPAPIPAIVLAAQTLLPIIEAGVGMLIARAPAPNSGMTPDTARLILAAAAR